MFSFSHFILAAATAAVCTVALSTDTTDAKDFSRLTRVDPPRARDTISYASYWWTEGDPQAVFTPNLPDGQFNITWSGNIGHFVGGKGWNPGSYDRYTRSIPSKLRIDD